MPSSSPELRRRWADADGRITDAVAVSYLEGRGFTLRRDWHWEPPADRRPVELTDDEDSAVTYLIEEWDYGPVICEQAGPPADVRWKRAEEVVDGGLTPEEIEAYDAAYDEYAARRKALTDRLAAETDPVAIRVLEARLAQLDEDNK